MKTDLVLVDGSVITNVNDTDDSRVNENGRAWYATFMFLHRAFWYNYTT